MVGLSVVLEAQRGGNSKKTPQVINKTMMLNKVSLNSHYSHFQQSTFLDRCFLCSKKLLLGKDIYMYKGDKAFCSVECRCKQIFMDEEETIQNENCSLAAMRPTSSSSSSGSSSSSSKASSHHHEKRTRNRNGGFAY